MRRGTRTCPRAVRGMNCRERRERRTSDNFSLLSSARHATNDLVPGRNRVVCPWPENTFRPSHSPRMSHRSRLPEFLPPRSSNPPAGDARPPRQYRVWVVGLVAFAVTFVTFVVANRLLMSGGAPPQSTERQSRNVSLEQHPVDPGVAVPGSPLPPDAIYRRCSPAVVQLIVRDRRGRTICTGSGFVVSTRGLIATTYHVVEKAQTADVILEDKTKLAVMGVAAADTDCDIAIVKVAGQVDVEPLVLAGPDLPPVGAKVFAIGNPLELANTLSDGLVSGHRVIHRMTMIQTTAPINPGSSGGPLLRDDGKVVGVTTSRFEGAQNLNFAVSASHVATLLRQCEAGGELKNFPLFRCMN